MDRKLQPQVESDCSQNVKNVGQLVIGGSAFALLGAFGQFNMPRIGEMGRFAHDMVPVLLCMGAWGVATGIGLLRAWPWARISRLVFSNLLAVYGLLRVDIFLLANNVFARCPGKRGTANCKQFPNALTLLGLASKRRGVLSSAI